MKHSILMTPTKLTFFSSGTAAACLGAILALTVAIQAPSALAQDDASSTAGASANLTTPAAESVAEDKKTKFIYNKSESHAFADLKLKGQLKKPEITYIYKRQGIRSEKILDLPDNFDADIAQSTGKF